MKSIHSDSWTSKGAPDNRRRRMQSQILMWRLRLVLGSCCILSDLEYAAQEDDTLLNRKTELVAIKQRLGVRSPWHLEHWIHCSAIVAIAEWCWSKRCVAERVSSRFSTESNYANVCANSGDKTSHVACDKCTTLLRPRRASQTSAADQDDGKHFHLLSHR